MYITVSWAGAYSEKLKKETHITVKIREVNLELFMNFWGYATNTEGREKRFFLINCWYNCTYIVFMKLEIQGSTFTRFFPM